MISVKKEKHKFDRILLYRFPLLRTYPTSMSASPICDSPTTVESLNINELTDPRHM